MIEIPWEIYNSLIIEANKFNITVEEYIDYRLEFLVDKIRSQQESDDLFEGDYFLEEEDVYT